MKQMMKYFSRRDLVECARRAEEWAFNKRIGPEVGGFLEMHYPVLYSFVHERRAGALCEPHVRCVVMIPIRKDRPNDCVLDLSRDDSLRVLIESSENCLHLIVDVPTAFFAGLTEREVVWGVEAASPGEGGELA